MIVAAPIDQEPRLSMPPARWTALALLLLPTPVTPPRGSRWKQRMQAGGAQLVAAQAAGPRGTRPALGAAAQPDEPESGADTPPMTLVPQSTGPDLYAAASAAGSHYCPRCLKRVRATV